jgi:hypothetical protein
MQVIRLTKRSKADSIINITSLKACDTKNKLLMRKYQPLDPTMLIARVNISVNVPEYKSFKCNFQIKLNKNLFRVRKQLFKTRFIEEGANISTTSKD